MSAANKRRKVEASNGSRPSMSAFAALRNLRGSKSLELNNDNPGSPEDVEDDKSSKAKPARAPPRQGKRRQVIQSRENGDISMEDAPSNVEPVKPTLPSPNSREAAVASDQPSAQQVPRVASLHSTFKPNKALKNFQRRAHGRTAVKLGEGERLVILGNYSLRVQEGTTTIYGATLIPSEKEKWYHVNATHCHALPVIRALEPCTLVIESQPRSHDLRALEKLNPVFSRLWNETSDRDADSFQIIYTSEDGPKRALLRDLVSPAEWNKKMAEISTPQKKTTPIIFVCGPKSSGKSTFGRLMANRLVTDQASTTARRWPSIGILDLDPGQPEYSPPGVISMNKITQPNLSPSFCHPAFDSNFTQLKAHAIASVTPALDPEHFIGCALDLVAVYRQDSGGKYPLVINTPGWIQGTGLDILMELVRKIQPTDVIYTSQEGPEETKDALNSACGKVPFQELPSQPHDYASRTSLHFRTMQTMSYFHLDWDSAGAAFPMWKTDSVTSFAPWCVGYKSLGRGFAGVLCYDYQPPLDLLADYINGKILALVHISGKASLGDMISKADPNKLSRRDSDADMEMDDEAPPSTDISADHMIARTPEGIPVIQNHRGRTLDPKFSRCIGLVLVRGIDKERGELHLLTPLPGDRFTKHSQELVLVAGNFDAPTWAYTEDLYKRAFGAARTDGNDQQPLDVIDEDTDDDSSQGGNEESVGMSHQSSEIPWVEVLESNQKRAVGSKVWRVRRDLGRG